MSINFNDKAHTYVSNAEYQKQLTATAIDAATHRCNCMLEWCLERGLDAHVNQGPCSASDIVLELFIDSTWHTVRYWKELNNLIAIHGIN